MHTRRGACLVVILTLQKMMLFRIGREPFAQQARARTCDQDLILDALAKGAVPAVLGLFAARAVHARALRELVPAFRIYGLNSDRLPNSSRSWQGHGSDWALTASVERAEPCRNTVQPCPSGKR